MSTNHRKGRPICISLDPDAEALLRAMTPNHKGLGLLLSELLRKEARERVGRPEWLDVLTRQETERLRLQQVPGQALVETAS